MNGDRDRSWWDRNWKWVVPLGCTGILATLLAFVALIVVIIFGSLRATGAYKEAVASAMADPEVLETLGEPVKVGWFVRGTVNVNGPSGDAKLSVPLVGRTARATLHVVAKKRAGRWEFELLEVDVEGREDRIDLLNHAEDPVSHSPLEGRFRVVESSGGLGSESCPNI